jgi:mRNA interferase MazF
MIGNRPPALIERGRTYFVDFNPTRGHEQAGIRPGVVVTSAEMSASGVLTVVPTTTQRLDRIYPYEVLVPAGRGLPETSKVLVNQLRTIDIAERLKEPIGRLDEELMQQIDRALVIVLFGPEMVA